MRKRRIIILAAFLLFIAGIIISYNLLQHKNKYVKEWSEYPRHIKWMNAKLFFERPIYWMLQPKIDTSSLSYSKADLLKSMQLGADWIVSMQEESGRFNYWYNPENDKYSSKYDDNFLRQAGTGYSLMLVYEMVNDEKYQDAALKNLEYLFQFKIKLDSTKSFFLYNQKAKLGGVALPMLTMLKYKEINKDTVFDTALRELAEMIIFLQSREEKGKFKSTYIYRGDYQYEKNSGWESQIYPGEAMLALTFMYKHFGDQKYLQSLDDAFHYYSIKGRWRHNSFIPWSSSAFAELYCLQPKEKYATFVYKMSDKILKHQNLNKRSIAYGSLFSAPSVFASTWFEGIGDAVKMAKFKQDTIHAKKYAERSLIAYQWLMKLQYQQGDSVPQQAVGGFRKSLQQPEIRIDNTQHAISAMYRGLKYIH